MLVRSACSREASVRARLSSRSRKYPVHPAATLSIMARSSKLITACVALAACVALRCLAFVSGPAPAAQLRGTTPLEVAAGAAVPAVMMTPTAAMAADGEGMPSVVLGVGILCMLAAFSAVSSVISATVTSELD